MYCVFVCNDAVFELIFTRPVFGDRCQNNYFVESLFKFEIEGKLRVKINVFSERTFLNSALWKEALVYNKTDIINKTISPYLLLGHCLVDNLSFYCQSEHTFSCRLKLVQHVPD